MQLILQQFYNVDIRIYIAAIPRNKNLIQSIKIKLYYEMWQTHTKHWKFSENDSAEKHKKNKTRKHKYTGKLEWLIQ